MFLRGEKNTSTMPTRSFLFLSTAATALLLILASGASAAKILAVPLPGADSHLFVLTALTSELVARGHDVLLAVSESDAETLSRAKCFSPSSSNSKNMGSSCKPYTRLTTYKSAFTKKEMKERVQNARQAVSNPFLGALESLVVYFQALISYCDKEMSDAAHVDVLVDFMPDLVIGDAVSPCGTGLAFKLPMMVAERGLEPPESWLRVAERKRQLGVGGLNEKENDKIVIQIPRVAVAVLPMLDPLLPNMLDNLPNHLGMVPQVGTGFPAAGRADSAAVSSTSSKSLSSHFLPLWQRCVNVAFYFGAHAIHSVRVKPLYVALGKRHGIEVDTKFLHSASLVLFNSDWAVEAPRPMPPSAIFVGSLLSRPAEPLPREPWDSLLGKRKAESEPNDVVYASLGTLVTISEDEYRAFARGLSLLAPTRVLWKLSDADLPGDLTVADLSLGRNVVPLAWVPQNDLLGDGRLAAFVTHGGLNSIYEAAYHGVPVVGIPIFGDQPDNVAKAVAGGWGVALPLRRLTPERLVDAVRSVVGSGEEREETSRSSYSPTPYRLAALRVSRRMRTRARHPASDAADAIEGVLATDGDMFLKTSDHLVPFYRYAMLDVVLVYCALFSAPFLVSRLRNKRRTRSSPSAGAGAASPPARQQRRPDTAFESGGKKRS